MDRSESIVTRGFLLKYNQMKSSFPRWLIIFTLGICDLIKNNRWLTESFSPSVSRSQEFETIRHCIDLAILLSRSMIVTFALDWTAFVQYAEQLSQMELEIDDGSVKQIKRERKLKNWFCFVSLISYVMNYKNSFLMLKLNMEIYKIFSLLVVIVSLAAHFFLIYLIIDLCICLKAAFRYINNHLARFEETSPKRMLSELRRNRIMYSCAVRASQEAEKFARHYIAWFYFQFILFFIVNIVDILGPKNAISVTFVLFMILDMITAGYLTLNLVAVNKVSTEGMEDLYEISYDLKSYNLQNENNLFLNRMLWHNVGFTVSNLFLINPNFITALLSFVLTIALTMANYLYK
uniref:Gustatory receptor n=1 Tax=Tetranychus urticae TaxID=32264 RepID=T1K9I2_TETUR